MVDRERETIITTDGGGRSGTSAVAVLAVVVVLLVLLFLLFGRGLLSQSSSPTKTLKADVDVNLPSTGGASSGDTSNK